MREKRTRHIRHHHPRMHARNKNIRVLGRQELHDFELRDLRAAVGRGTLCGADAGWYLHHAGVDADY